MNNNIPNMAWYNFRIKGTHKDTNRKRTITVISKSEEAAQQEASSQGLLPPLEVMREDIPIRKPSDRQLEYARHLGITIPENDSMEHVSYLISCHLGDYKQPNPGLVEFAYNRNIYFSKYIGKAQLYNTVFDALDDMDKVAFFVLSIYRWLSEDRYANLDTHPYVREFYEFATKWCTDKKFMKSLNTYQGEDLRFFGKITSINDDWESTYEAGSNKTFAYKTSANFLHEKFNTPLTKNRTLMGHSSFNDDRKEDFITPPIRNVTKSGSGCLLPILFFFVVITLLI